MYNINLNADNKTGGENMTSKELLYVEDALGHEQYFKTKCCEAHEQLNDATLKNTVADMQQQHQQIFDSFLNLLNQE